MIISLRKEHRMKCPNCRDRQHIDVEKGDGFTENDTRECLTCGTVWYYNEKDEHTRIIKEGDPLLKKS